MIHVHDMPEFQALHRRRKLLSWGLAVPLATAYIVLGLACVYARDWLSVPLGDGPFITRALVLALSLIAASVIAALVYVRISNGDLENRREALLAKLNDE